MIRRLIVLSLAVYAIVVLSKAGSRRAAEAQTDARARADWESEGGNPLPDPVDGAVSA